MSVPVKWPVLCSEPTATLNIDGKQDEWIMLDLTAREFYVALQLILEVDDCTVNILQKSVYELSADSLLWVSLTVIKSLS